MRIALLGSAPSSARLAPFRDVTYREYVAGRPMLERHQFPYVNEDWQIWGCSPGLYGVAERTTRWFELHRWEPGQPWFSPEYCDWLRSFKGILYTTEVIPELPASTRIPREEIIKEFGIYFLTSSLSFMFALAIMEIDKARQEEGHDPTKDQIGLWGVDMAAAEEYQDQRAGCQFFMREAALRGIQVVLPPESDLAQPKPMYGVQEWSAAHIKCLARVNELRSRHAVANQRMMEAQQEVIFLNGAIEDMEYMMKTWVLNQASPLVVPDETGRQLQYLDAKRL